jgi:FAD/FMN-containing dehydrogenase
MCTEQSVALNLAYYGHRTPWPILGRTNESVPQRAVRSGGIAVMAHSTAVSPDAVAGLTATTIDEFAAGLRGPVLQAGDADFEEARTVQNGLIDRHPAMIARVRGTADVVDAVGFAREHGLPLSTKAGGHSVAGNSVNDDGLVIDLSLMRGVRVDPAAKTVRVQGGALWGDVDRETQLFGLATPGGVVSTTGVAGLTLHGGYGHLRRQFGLSLDNLLSVDIVTADGQVRTASQKENADLFWAVRGAGSNFGVVTSFEFRAHPVGPLVHLCAPFYSLDDGERVLRAWRDFTATTPDEITSMLVFWSVPDNEHFPAEHRGKPVLIPATVHSGSFDAGEEAMRPLRELATPLLDLSGPIPYTAVQAAFDPFFPKGQLYYWKSTYLDDLSDAAIASILQVAAERPSPLSDLILWQLGGAMSRVGATDTAYGRRDAPYLLNAEATWLDPRDTDRSIAWSRNAIATWQQFSNGGSYLNFSGFGEEKEALLRAAYGSNYDRLAALKAEYDPTNLFRTSLNIPPVAAASR